MKQVNRQDQSQGKQQGLQQARNQSLSQDHDTGFTHLNSKGEAHMVDVSAKEKTSRRALAQAEVQMKQETLTKLLAGDLPKGDVLAVVRTAGIMAAKKTSDLIPLCHPLMLTKISIEIKPIAKDLLRITADVSCDGQTGVEMEALTAASVAALTLYDMCKAVDKGMQINHICLLEKSGGRSGQWFNETLKKNDLYE